MSEKQMALDTFFEKAERVNGDTGEDTKIEKTNPEFKRQYQESYTNFEFMTTANSHSLNPLCITYGNWLSNKAM